MTVLHIVSPGAAAGKTIWGVALARTLRARGSSVAVVKPVAVVSPLDITDAGISIAAAHLAAAAGDTPTTWINPVVVAKESPTSAGVLVLGELVGTVPLLGRDCAILEALDARAREAVAQVVVQSIERAMDRGSIVLAEGAGGVADLHNLGMWDPANIDVMRMADASVMVARFSRGGALSSIWGARQLLDRNLHSCVRGFALNEVRVRELEVTAAADALGTALGLPFLGFTPRIPHFDGRPSHAPDTPEGHSDHAALAAAFAEHARWPALGTILG